MTKRLAIIRSAFHYLDFKKYNCQEVGLGSSLCEKGWNVDLYIYGKKENKEIVYHTQECTLTVYRISAVQLLRQQAYYPRLLKVLSRKQYDLIQVQDESNFTSVQVVKWAYAKEIPVVLYQGMYQPYSGIKGILQKIFNIWALPRYRKYLTYSLAKTISASKYLQHLHILPVELLRVGLDVRRFQTPAIQYYDKDLLLFSKEFESIMLYIGILEQRRNPDFTIRLFHRLCKDNNIGLVLIGDGPEKERIDRLINFLGLTDRVYYCKSVPNESIPQYFQEADFFVLPSDYEILGMVVLESLYFMVPVIATNTAGTSDILQDLTHGMILSTLDVEEWSLACKKYMRNRHNRNVELRDYVIQTYNWDQAAELYISYYEKYCS